MKSSPCPQLYPETQPIRAHQTLATLPESQGTLWQEERLEESQPWPKARGMPFPREGPRHQNRTWQAGGMGTETALWVPSWGMYNAIFDLHPDLIRYVSPVPRQPNPTLLLVGEQATLHPPLTSRELA